MRTVQRYALDTSEVNTIDMPLGAKVISVRKSAMNMPYICAIVDSDYTNIDRKFLVIPEGKDCRKAANKQYYGHFDFNGDTFHVFDGGMVGV